MAGARTALRFHIPSAAEHSSFLRAHAERVLGLSTTHSVRVLTAAGDRDADADTRHGLSDGVSGELEDEEQEKGGVPGDNGLDVGWIARALETSWLGRVLVHADCVASTQDVLRRTLGTWPGRHGWVATADVQTAGRGRRGTSWVAPHGSVALTLAVSVPLSESALIFVQYLGALAVAEVALGGDRRWRTDVGIKWPNDVYAGGRKVAGLLCEASLRGSRDATTMDVFVGVGVNVINHAPSACLLTATDADQQQSARAREDFITQFLAAFERLFDEFQTHGFDRKIRQRYMELWLHRGQQVRLGGVDGPIAIVEGLAPNGWIRVRRLDWDALQDLPPDDTSFNLDLGVVTDKVPGGEPV